MLDPKTQMDIRVDQELSKAEWTPSAALSYFDGHFPNNPILPGVAIIDASIETLRRVLKLEDLRVKSIKTCKFTSPILPNTTVEIAFRETNTHEWHFEWRAKDGDEPRPLLAQLTFVIAI